MWCCCLCTNEDGAVKGLRAYRRCSLGSKRCGWHKSRGTKLLSPQLRCQKWSSCSSAGPECLGRYSSELGWSWDPACWDEKPPCVYLHRATFASVISEPSVHWRVDRCPGTAKLCRDLPQPREWLGTSQDHGSLIWIARRLGNTVLSPTSRQVEFKEGKETASEPQSKLSVVWNLEVMHLKRNSQCS